MSHHIYNTKAFVLGSRAQKERDKTFTLLTEDLGLVFATAQGIRRESSKLGGVLLDYALVHISLVKGKNAWRITTASLIEDSAALLRTKRLYLKSLAQVFVLIERLIKGEEKHKELFEEVERGVAFFLQHKDVDCNGWEVLMVLRILFHLGYISTEDVSSTLLTSIMSEALVQEALLNKRTLVAHINSGIRESGLS